MQITWKQYAQRPEERDLRRGFAGHCHSCRHRGSQGARDRAADPRDRAPSLIEARGRVARKSIFDARMDLPPFDNSAMDGYAVRMADLTGSGPWDLGTRWSDRGGGDDAGERACETRLGRAHLYRRARAEKASTRWSCRRIARVSDEIRRTGEATSRWARTYGVPARMSGREARLLEPGMLVDATAACAACRARAG